MIKINEKRLIEKLNELGKTGFIEDGTRTRVFATDEDKEGRDLIVAWMKELSMDIKVDKIGNIFGIWQNYENKGKAPIMTGSHVDSVINAGQYDGCLGIVAGLEVVKSLQEENFRPQRPIVVAVFSNEEGIRYQPDMMGSFVYAGGLDVNEALNIEGIDGTILSDELERIGYLGDEEPGFIKPKAFVELHIEQGPIMDSENISIGAVENLQGISWQKITIKGVANHAGTTPTSHRKDAGLAASKINVFLRKLCDESKNGKTVATVGTMEYKPNSINQIPSEAIFTVDLRNPDKEILKDHEKDLDEYIKRLEKEDGVTISKQRLVSYDPVLFDQGLVKTIEESAKKRGFSCKKMTSGAGQDAQMMAMIAPTAMIFIPSVDGISHNPDEFSKDEDVINGANVLLDLMKEYSK